MKLLLISIPLLLVGCANTERTIWDVPQVDPAQKISQLEAFIADLKQDARIRDIRLEVIKRCADKGFIPVLKEGNVDCKAMPTKVAKPKEEKDWILVYPVTRDHVPYIPPGNWQHVPFPKEPSKGAQKYYDNNIVIVP